MVVNYIDKIALEFEGYYDVDKFVPNKAGIYCIYRANPNVRKITGLIYIGQSRNIQQRLADHEHHEDWENELYSGERLICSFAPIVSSYNRGRAEAALIYVHKRRYPDLINTSGTESFNCDDVIITTAGENAGLYGRFAIYKEDGETKIKIIR